MAAGICGPFLPGNSAVEQYLGFRLTAEDGCNSQTGREDEIAVEKT